MSGLWTVIRYLLMGWMGLTFLIALGTLAGYDRQAFVLLLISGFFLWQLRLDQRRAGERKEERDARD